MGWLFCRLSFRMNTKQTACTINSYLSYVFRLDHFALWFIPCIFIILEQTFVPPCWNNNQREKQSKAFIPLRWQQAYIVMTFLQSLGYKYIEENGWVKIILSLKIISVYGKNIPCVFYEIRKRESYLNQWIKQINGYSIWWKFKSANILSKIL